jgi:hypothetical protein
MPTQALRYRFDSALLLRQRDLAPEEYAVYLIEVVAIAYNARRPSLRRSQQRPS